MKINKKGLTLVELLAVIVLIALLLGLGIPGINRISQNMKKKSFNTKVGLIEQAAVLWGQDNKTLLQAHDNCVDKDGNTISCYKVQIQELIEEDCLDSEDYNDITYKNPINDDELADDCVYVYKKNNRVYAYFSTSNSCPVKKPIIVDSTSWKESGEWHNQNFRLSFTAETGAKIYYGFDVANVNTEAYFLDVTEEISSQTVYVKACKDGMCSNNASYEIKLDKQGPMITNFGVSYDNDSLAKLSFGANDTLSTISSYKITSDSTCNSDSWKTANMQTISDYHYFSNVSEEQNKNYYFCVKDNAGNISSSSQFVANCAVQAKYTCNDVSDAYYSYMQKISCKHFSYCAVNYDFYATSFSKKDLKIIFKTPDEHYGFDLTPEQQIYIQDPINGWNWETDCVGSFEIEVLYNGITCYKKSINRTY